MEITDFRVEYRKNPIGLSVKNPRFSWKLKSNDNNVKQKAYHLQVVSNGKTAWDSERTESENSILISYMGNDLEEEKEYQVKLTVEDNYGNIAEKKICFETGIFDTNGFQAQMITHDFETDETACPVFYKQFSVLKK